MYRIRFSPRKGKWFVQMDLVAGLFWRDVHFPLWEDGFAKFSEADAEVKNIELDRVYADATLCSPWCHSHVVSTEQRMSLVKSSDPDSPVPVRVSRL